MTKSKGARQVLAFIMALALALSLVPAISFADDSSDMSYSIDLAALLEDGSVEWQYSDDGTIAYLSRLVYCTTPEEEATFTEGDDEILYETLNIFVPAEFLEGESLCGYNAETAPIVVANECSGWNSSTPLSFNSSAFFVRTIKAFVNAGIVYVSVGARSRDLKVEDADGNFEYSLGKAPTPVVDLKAAVRYLRANADSIPGDINYIVSVGTSGGGEMSSILGASGDMDEYYEYLYEIGAAGITKNGDTYTSTISDAVYAAQCFCPIADIDNADMAYAWMHFDSTINQDYSEFKLALQNDLAVAFAEYINAMGLEDENGNVLSFDYNVDGTINPRAGSYYTQILANMADALEQYVDYYVAAGDAEYSTRAEYVELTYPDAEWISVDEDDNVTISDMSGFISGTGLNRNKNIPGFDVLDNSAENTAFGTDDMEASHYSASVAAVLEANYDVYAELNGFDADQVKLYIEQANDDYVVNQAYLMNATQIMLAIANGDEEGTPATYWRTRNGTADQHTSFTIAYNLAMAANMVDTVEGVDYSLVWAMGHGSDEGETTGTVIDWIYDICVPDEDNDDSDVEMPEPLTFWGETYEWEYVPAVEGEEYQGLDLTAVAYYKIFNVPYIENAPVYTYGSTETVVQKINIFVPAAYFEDGGWNGTIDGYTIDTAPIIYKNSNSGWNTGLPQKGFQYVWEDNGNLAVEDGDCLENGFIYITVGSRGRNIASSPAMIADLKAGVRFLKANADQIPGDTEKIVSIADSGGGAASSLVGATGDMAEYYPYLYEIGALGVEWIGTTPYDSASDEEKADTTNYKSTISDAVYAAMMYCPILDLNNADLAYAWMHFDDGITQMVGWGGYTTFTDYQLQLQNDLAVSFIDYVNGLELLRPYSGEVLVLDDGEDGTTLSDARDGTYYQAVLDEMSKALTAYIANEEWKTQNTAGYSLPFTYPYADCVDATDYLMTAYGDYNEGTPDTWDWLEIDGDVYTITDMGAFIRGTDLGRNK
ncbi:MAG: hypothetical protein LIO52_07660, partial [Oscillospiraceae bacterium]|nr:hypothetical protein [Oscillospiraceae bacterium]